MTPTMMRRALIAAGVVLLIIGVSMWYQHNTRWQGITPAVRDSMAVLHADKRRDSVAHAVQLHAADSLTQVVQVRVDTVRIIEQHAGASHARAQVNEAAARTSSTAADSAKYYRLAFLDEQQRGDSLARALQKEHDNTRDALAAAAHYQLADSVSSTRLRRVEALNVSLVNEVARASGGCHLLPFVPCPTRTQAVVVSALVTYAVVRSANHLPVLPTLH